MDYSSGEAQQAPLTLTYILWSLGIIRFMGVGVLALKQSSAHLLGGKSLV